MFVGYGRSGHSFIGSALDAHPCICITHEADAIRRSESEFAHREALFDALKRHNQAIVQAGRLTHNRWGEPYGQAMEGQLKSDYTAVKVLGNKNGSVETGNDRQAFRERLERFEQFLGAGINVKLLAVLRNPFDAGLLDGAVFSLLQWVTEEYRERVHVLRHEDFIDKPEAELKRLCVFLDVPIDRPHLEVVQGAVFKNPHKSRYLIEYCDADRRAVQSHIDRNPLFAGYSFYS